MPETMCRTIATIALLFCIFASLSSGSLLAAVITNLDSNPRQFDVKTGEGFKTVTLAAGATWRLPGRARVRYRGREVEMNEDEEFAIWNEAEFGPQRRVVGGGGIVHN